jgi:transcriptional regulator of acetoin/glycerol metabolism
MRRRCRMQAFDARLHGGSTGDLEHAFVICGGNWIEVGCLPKDLTVNQEETDSSVSVEEDHPFGKAEIEIVKRILEKSRGNRTKAAQELGISRATLWRKIKRDGLT